jgi:hypothetical protein
MMTGLGWDEATDEPGSAQQRMATTAREDQPSPGYGATGVRPTEMANYVASKT